MNKTTSIIKATIASTALALLVSCGGGGSTGSTAPSTVVISGVVSDDIIVGATITATSLDTG